MLSAIKKNLLLVLLLVSIFMTSSSFTQEEFRLNKSRVTLNAGVQFPVSSFIDSVKTGFGSLITFDYSPPSSLFSFSFSAGFNFWKYKDSTVFMGYTYSAIPMVLGISYH